MNVQISELAPVIYAGNGSGDYNAPSNTVAEHLIDGNIPSGGRIVEAWYSPYDNIGDLSSFSQIDVRREDNQRIKLVLKSYPGRTGQLRIRITILYTTP